MSGPVKIVKTKLFIGNLDPGTQPEELSELFSAFGTVLESSVIKDYGFIHFGSIEEAEKAALALNNKEFHGKRLRVELSTSTVRHRPGQPEPASALRHSRARTSGKGQSNGAPRYNSGAAAGGGGGGPMRHNAAAWSRHNARPYDNMPIDHSPYDRARPYDIRSESQRYYDERRDNGYGLEYDASRYGRHSGGGQPEARHYRDVPSHARADSYGPNRSYDRHLGMPPGDPYYGGGLPQEPPPIVDPYHHYDPYQKYYASRPRDPEYPSPRDYDPYANYRHDPYGMSNGSQGARRHDLPVDLPPSQEGYPSSHRQHPSYSSGSSNLPPYYGIQQR